MEAARASSLRAARLAARAPSEPEPPHGSKELLKCRAEARSFQESAGAVGMDMTRTRTKTKLAS